MKNTHKYFADKNTPRFVSRLIIKKTIEDECGRGMKGVNFEYLKEDVRDQVGKFLFQKTQKQPMVIPVLLGI